jgi:hypothetical protein
VVVPPIPTLPFWSTESIVAPVEDAITNGLVPAVPWRLKVTVDEVALTPETVPLSRNRPVVSDVAEAQRVRNPVVPPDTEAVIPRDEVATQRVDVPVDQRTCPNVPDAVVESRSAPVSVSAEMVEVARVEVPCTLKRPVVVRLVADALAKVVCAPTLRV